MKKYRLTFVNNEVTECKEEQNETELSGKYHYEHNRGYLTYAIVKADTEEAAKKMSNQIVIDLARKNPTFPYL